MVSTQNNTVSRSKVDITGSPGDDAPDALCQGERIKKAGSCHI